MEKWKTEESQVKIICIGAVVVLIAILVPLFWISSYNFMSADDFVFAKGAEAVWKETHSVVQVMQHQLGVTVEMYHTWQGTYFDIWFCTSMMGLFIENMYYMGTVLSLGGFVLAEFMFFMVVLVKGMGADKFRAATVTISCMVLQILLTPYPVEGYFWFCGAIRYTFVHSLALLLLLLLFQLNQALRKKKVYVVLLESGIVCLSVAVGGSNYVTALTVLVLYTFYVIWLFFKKKPFRVMVLCNGILYLAAFAVNILAPGNLNRQNASGVEQISAINSIILSIKEALEYIFINAIPPCVILGIMFIPLFLGIVKQRNYRYPWPLMVSAISFGVFAVQFTPTIYALQITGAGRIQNLYRINYYVWLYGNELYWIGWLWRKYCERSEKVDDALQGKINKTSYLLEGWMIGVGALCISIYLWGGSTVTSLSAIDDLRSGTARQYYEEYQERLEILEDDSKKEVYLKPFSVKPYLLFFTDIEDDADDWVNGAMAQYYGKEKVKLSGSDGVQ